MPGRVYRIRSSDADPIAGWAGVQRFRAGIAVRWLRPVRTVGDHAVAPRVDRTADAASEGGGAERTSPRRARTMKKHGVARRWLVPVAAVAAVAWIGAAEAVAQPSDRNIAAGRRLYHQKADCQACHGWSGDGMKMDNQAPDGANLRESGLGREQLVFVIKCGLPGREMPAFDGRAYTDDRCVGRTQRDLDRMGLSLPETGRDPAEPRGRAAGGLPARQGRRSGRDEPRALHRLLGRGGRRVQQTSVSLAAEAHGRPRRALPRGRLAARWLLDTHRSRCGDRSRHGLLRTADTRPGAASGPPM